MTVTWLSHFLYDQNNGVAVYAKNSVFNCLTTDFKKMINLNRSSANRIIT